MTIDKILFGVTARFAESYCLAQTDRERQSTDYEFEQFFQDSHTITPQHKRQFMALYELIKHDYEDVKTMQKKVKQ